MAAESQHGSPERPLPESVEVKPGLHWRPLNVGDSRAVAICRQQLQTRSGTARDKCAAAGKAGRTELCEPVDVRHGGTGQVT